MVEADSREGSEAYGWGHKLLKVMSGEERGAFLCSNRAGTRVSQERSRQEEERVSERDQEKEEGQLPCVLAVGFRCLGQ